ncbi:tetratricopeptide repeat protein [Marinithermus hydrothermalis]|uniref:TPR repeat-containing protein n=1 Tax=Marinithermus hydrothermalis (strain DSM 14884 / JCM 11576 / T1) TaxID=869210 RepID=F2NNX3_MARHT|nr:tetratricopeptide repeat protein [Marinithermus hydrothermalis]AEB11561.1 TPR repeat-containing protein [Marinithermus hydrothermalis DSM 14884]
MELELKRYLRQYYHVDAPVAPGRFEAELAKRIGAPKRRKPVLQAWRRYLHTPGQDSVRSFYGTVLAHTRERLEALVYALHYPFLQFYAETIPEHLPETGRVLEVGAFTGALVNYLALARPELEWHALDPVEAAVQAGRAYSERIGVRVAWHAGWFETWRPEQPFDAVLLLSVLPEGYLTADLEPTLEAEAFYTHFAFFERFKALEGMLRPGGTVVYGHGPFLGKNAEATAQGLEALGFSEVGFVGKGDYVLVVGRMPEALRVVRPARREAQPSQEPPARTVDEATVQALLEAEDYATVLATVPEDADGTLAYARGRALFALGRYAEALGPLQRAHVEAAEHLRLLALVELGRYREALPQLERLGGRGDTFALALGRAYLGVGRIEDAIRVLWRVREVGGEAYLEQALDQLASRAFRFLREGQYVEASRRVEFVEDLSPALLGRDLLYLGLQAALEQGLWGRAERYAQRLYDLGEAIGAVGLAFARLKARTPEALESVRLRELKAVEPYLTDAVARREEPMAVLALGLLRYREGRHEEAAYFLERAAREGRGDMVGIAYHYLALARRALKHPIQSILGEHKRAHAYRPYPAGALFAMAQEALEAGEAVLAREFLSYVRDAGLEHLPAEETVKLVRLVEALEGPWEAFCVLSGALERTLTPTREHLELAYRLSRNFRESEEAERVRTEYLTALYRAGERDRVEALLREELAARPAAVEVLFDLAEHLEGEGRYQEAAEVWKQALEVAYYREKDLDLAREVLRNLLFLNPHDPELELYLEELKATAKALARLEAKPDPLAEKTPEGIVQEGVPRFHGEYLVVVGGHTQLRSRLTPVMERAGLVVDWFDSDSTTAARETLKRIQNRLVRAHGVMIVSSYVGHDLSEPIREEALRLGVPVYITPGRARGVTGFLRALREFAPQVYKKALEDSPPTA